VQNRAYPDAVLRSTRQVEFKRGPYNGTRSLDTKQFRVVGVLVADADDYHLYMTNLARNEFFPADYGHHFGVCKARHRNRKPHPQRSHNSG